MKIRPIRDWIVVKRAEAEAEEKGLIIPEAFRLKSRHGEVLAVGSGQVLESGEVRPLDVKVGDIVHWRGIHGIEVEVDGEDLIILKEDEIIGVRVS